MNLLYDFIRVTMVAGVLYSFLVSSALAGNYGDCEYKRHHLEKQLEYAQAYNNTHRMAGLQEALHQVNEHCTENRLLERKEDKVSVKHRKIAEPARELEQGRKSG
ncbi:DUF1090 domain-containing protein [Salmonella enterica]|nr:DUF1090 domain-containing protein [Salmonella enterica]ECE0741996.1 DUF1090 domain-containing protein [Salmonella enterica subsp. enterica serovar Hvittingfoss]EGA8118251.1 DUF1090 domain-containing protein [Salmonella enterica]EHO8673530.1 DUF1090 domain-containing protein [Salmonella enterica]